MIQHPWFAPAPLSRLLGIVYAGIAMAALAPSAVAQVPFTGSYTQNFDSLPNSGTLTWANNGTLPGWFAYGSGIAGINNFRDGGAVNPAFVFDNGSSNSGGLHSYGSTSATDRALGSVGSSGVTAGDIVYALVLQNTSGSAYTSFTLNYNGEQWRQGGQAAGSPPAGTHHSLILDFRTFSSSPAQPDLAANFVTGYTAPGAPWDFTGPIGTVANSGSVVDGNIAGRINGLGGTASINWLPGEYLVIRWWDDNNTGNDHGLGIDDLTVTASGSCQAAAIATDPLSVTTCGSAPPTFSVVASGTAPLTYQWSAAFGLGPFVDIPSATGDSYTPPAYSASDSGVQFRCSVTNACGAAVSNLATWTINGSTLVDPDHTACEGEVVTFHAAGSNTPSGFQWQIGGADADCQNGAGWADIPGAIFPDYTKTAAAPDDNTQYRCLLTYADGCTTSSCPGILLRVNRTPIPALSSAPSWFCAESVQNITLLSNAQGTQWFADSSFTVPIGSGTSLVLQAPASTTTYYARAMDPDTGCISPGGSVTVTVFAPATAPSSVSVNHPTSCFGDPGGITLTAQGGAGDQFVWRLGSCAGPIIGTGLQISFATPEQSTTYFGHWQTLECGSSACLSASVTVPAHPTAPASVSADRQSVCPGDTAPITLSSQFGSGASFVWTVGSCAGAVIGSGTSIMVPPPAATTTYFGHWHTECGDSACQSVTIGVLPAPVAPTSATVDQPTMCPGQFSSINLLASGGAGDQFAWTAGACNGKIVGTTPNLWISAPSVTTTYFAHWTSACGDSACLSVTVTVLPTPVAPEFVLVNHPTICSSSGEMVDLTAIGGSGDEVIWTVGACEGSIIGTGPSLSIDPPLSTTTYFAHWQGICGRSPCASMTVTVVDSPTASAGGPYAACAVNPVSVSGAATSHSSVQWITSGTGSFADPSSLSTVYSPSAVDRAAGGVTLTLRAFPNASCADPVDSSPAILLISPQPFDVYVDSSWAFLPPGFDPSGPATSIGCDAFATIQPALDAAATGGTVHIAMGVYPGGILVSRPVTITGAGMGGTLIVPPMVDSHDCSTFDGLSINGIKVRSSDVAISNLTIDGNDNTFAPGTLNFRQGIVIDSSTGTYDRLSVLSVEARNIFRSGFCLFGGTGHSLASFAAHNCGNTPECVGYGVVLIDGDDDESTPDLWIDNGVIDACATGIGTDRADGPNADLNPRVRITRVQISDCALGMNLSGLSGGSVVGGSRADGNSLIGRDGATDRAIIVQHALDPSSATDETVTLSDNTITGFSQGLWLYHNERSAAPIIIRSNSITGPGADTPASRGALMTDDGSFFGEEDASSYASFSSNSIAGFDVGIEVFRNGETPAGGRELRALIGGVAPDQSNSITNNRVGVRVFDSGGPSGAQRRALAAILNNSSSIVANSVGIDVDGGAALIENNDLTGNSRAAVRVANNGLADAGDCAGRNLSGLGAGSGPNGSSAGLNNLSGYGADSSPPFAIEVLNLSAQAGVTALGNNFGTSPGDNNIHALISDAYNDASLSAVTFSNNIIVASAPPDTIVACDGVIGPGAGTYVEFLAQGGLVSSSDGGVSFTESVIGTNPTVIARVYTISDVCGQSTTSTQLLTVIDSIAPVPDVDPLPLIAGQCSAFVSAAPTATDACTGTVIATTNDPLFYAAPGTYTIHWTYTDGNGISTTQPQTVIVQDTIPPLVTTHNLTVTLDAAGTASITPDQVVSSANDDCGVVNLVSVSPSTFSCANIGSPVIVTVSFDDGHGNNGTASASVSIIDATPPAITAHDITVSLDASGNASITPAEVYASGSDNCGSVNLVSVTPNHFTCADTNTPVAVILTADDGHGNTATATLHVVVVDATPPTISGCPGDITLPNEPGQCGAPVSWPALTAMDNCGVAAFSSNFTPGAVFPVGSTTVTYTAVDHAGLVSTCSFNVTVNDTEPPAVACHPASVTLGPTGTATITAADVVTSATDNCGTASIASITPSTFDCSTIGPNAVTITAIDSHGNTTTCATTVTVSGNPVITHQPDPGSVCERQHVIFSVAATGPGTLLYQWRLNGIDIPSATDPVYTIPSATLANAGSYTVRINSDCGSSISTPAPLAVDHCPVIYVNHSAAGDSNGTAWPDAYPDLQSALAVALPGDQVWVAAGDYLPDAGSGDRNASFHLVSGVTVLGGFTGVETLPTQRNAGLNTTILSGDIGVPGADLDNSFHVVTSGGVTSGTLLDGFTIERGNANGAGADAAGAGIYNVKGDPTLANLVIRDNNAIRGGGLYNASASPSLLSIDFLHNTAADGGGALRNITGAPTLALCRFLGNTATSGGAVFNSAASDLSLIQCAFSGNHAAASGGAVYQSIGSHVLLTSGTITLNTADAQGGGVYSTNTSSSVEVINSILYANSDSSGTTEASQLTRISGSASASHSCIQGLTLFAGSGNIGNDPLFVSAAGPDGIPGTLDDDLALRPGSRCIDAGDNTAAPPDTFDLDDDGDTAEPVPLDLMLAPRFHDDPAIHDAGIGPAPIMDIGALEFQGTSCPCDFNRDGALNSQDFFDFLAAFFAQNADFNGNGTTDSQDFFDFLTCFFAACG